MLSPQALQEPLMLDEERRIVYAVRARTEAEEPTSCANILNRSAAILISQIGAITNATGSYQKRFGDLDGLYGNAAAYSAMRTTWGTRVVYEVSEFRPSDRCGDIVFGLTRMLPGKVGENFFMTRGHIHRRADRPEIYYGQKGNGLMLMELPEGETRIVDIAPYTCCYVPPFWIHRSVNTGAEVFVMTFGYPADSGQDYDIIARAGGMRTRIVDDGGGWKAVENPSSNRANKRLGRHFREGREGCGMSYRPATQPTLYFIGVTTGKSSIMRVFPAWAAAWPQGRGDHRHRLSYPCRPCRLSRCGGLHPRRSDVARRTGNHAQDRPL